jgi:nucleoid-associated protein YgaU
MPDHFQPLQQQAPVASSPAGVIVEPPQLPQAVKKGRHHKIRDGDTLESLALRYLDDEGRANEIFAANRTILNDPTLLPIGAQLTIPDEDRPATSPASTELVPLPGRSSSEASGYVRFRKNRLQH